jgi:hypothetical protein
MRCNPLQRLTLRLSLRRRSPRADRLLSFSDFQAGRTLTRMIWRGRCACAANIDTDTEGIGGDGKPDH